MSAPERRGPFSPPPFSPPFDTPAGARPRRPAGARPAAPPHGGPAAAAPPRSRTAGPPAGQEIGIGEFGDHGVVTVGGRGPQQQRPVVEQQLEAAQEAGPLVVEAQLALAARRDRAAAVEDAEALAFLEHAGALVGAARRGGDDVVLLGSRLRRLHRAPPRAGRDRPAGSRPPCAPP